MGDTAVRMRVPYFQVPNAIFDAELDPYEKLAYMYLARCGNHGGTSFPSYRTIAKKCSMSRRKAIDAVRTLEEQGFLTKERRRKGDKNETNLYIVEHDLEQKKGGDGAQGASPGAHHAPGDVHRMHQGGAPGAPNKEPQDKEQGEKDRPLGGDSAGPKSENVDGRLEEARSQHALPTHIRQIIREMDAEAL